MKTLCWRSVEPGWPGPLKQQETFISTKKIFFEILHEFEDELDAAGMFRREATSRGYYVRYKSWVALDHLLVQRILMHAQVQPHPIDQNLQF